MTGVLQRGVEDVDPAIGDGQLVRWWQCGRYKWECGILGRRKDCFLLCLDLIAYFSLQVDHGGFQALTE